MNTRTRIFTGLLMAAILAGCKGDTSTADLLNGNFINKLADTSPPNILTPKDGEVLGLKVVFQWTAKAGASKYTIDVATDSAFSNTITGSPFTVDAPNSSLTVDLSTNGTYYWRVKADTTTAGQYGSGSFDVVDSVIYVYCPVPAAGSSGTWTNLTTANGLGSNVVKDVYATGSHVYVATTGGVSVSINNGQTFSNSTTANGLGSNTVNGLYPAGNTLYAATSGGVSISLDNGSTWINYTTANGLGSNTTNKITKSLFSGITAATTGGLSSSSNGTTWSNQTNANTAGGLVNDVINGVFVDPKTLFTYAATAGGLSVNNPWVGWATYTAATAGFGSSSIINGVFSAGDRIYAATANGMAVSTNAGSTWTNYLSTNQINNVYVDVTADVIYAATNNGLFVSVNGGTSWVNYTIANGLGSNTVYGVYASGSSIYAATAGGLSKFSATSTCTDVNVVGNKSKPFQTIMGGISAALQLGKKDVYVASRDNSGTAYQETLVIKDNISLHGGWDANFTAQNMNNKTNVWANTSYVAYARDIARYTLIEGFAFSNVSTGIANTFGISTENCQLQLIIQNNTINAGAAAMFSSGVANTGSSPSILSNTINGGVGVYAIGISNNTFSLLNILSSPNINGNIINGGNTLASIGIMNAFGAPLITNNTINVDKNFMGIGIYNTSTSLISGIGSPVIIGNIINAASTGINNDPSAFFNPSLNSSNGTPTVSITIIANNTINAKQTGIMNNQYTDPVQGVTGYGIIDTIANNTITIKGDINMNNTMYGLNDQGHITTMSNNTIAVDNSSSNASWVSNYGISTDGVSTSQWSPFTISSNKISVLGGTNGSVYGIYNTRQTTSNQASHTVVNNNTIDNAVSGTGSSYGVYYTNVSATIGMANNMEVYNNSINAGSGSNTYGVYISNRSTTYAPRIELYNNTIHGGSGLTNSYGIWVDNVGTVINPTIDIKNNNIFNSGMANNRYGIYEFSSSTTTTSSPTNLLNNNVFDSGSLGKYYVYADKPNALTTGTTCINAAAVTDTTRNCYTVATSNLNVNGTGAVTASGNINIANTGNQLFVKAPVMYDITQDGPDVNTTYDGTTSTIEVAACNADSRYVLNQFFVYNNDGIVRTITGVNCTASASLITFTPVFATATVSNMPIVLWGTNATAGATNVFPDFHLKAPVAATCNVFFGGLDMSNTTNSASKTFTNDMDSLLRTANLAGLPCTLTVPSSALGAGWSIGADERD
ncbi:MAG: hypothetical protein OEV66_02150 [Spirochaetia bacterium]|nr:hypothetical protein [Spirochaetia bacterium]